MRGEQALLLAVLRDERGDHVAEIRDAVRGHRLEAEQRELDVDVGDQLRARTGRLNAQAASVSRLRMRNCCCCSSCCTNCCSSPGLNAWEM